MTEPGFPEGTPLQEGLDPVKEPQRWEALVARINQAAAPLLEARRPASLWQILSTWRRPVAWGSAGLVTAAVLSLLVLPSGATGSSGEVILAEAVVPWTVAAWMEGEYNPTVMELVQSVEAYAP